MTKCSIDDCNNISKTRGWCTKHYGRWHTHGDPNIIIKIIRKPCKYNNCTILSHAKGYCKFHYHNLWKYNDPGHVSTKAPTGSGHINKRGYKQLHINGKLILEHRFVMELYLGRPLVDHENVHHINGNRSDNRIENLELWSTLQPVGQRVQDKIEYAKMILSLYKDAQLP